LRILAALQFLTVIPVKRRFSAKQLGRSTAYFPVVGIIIGLILAALNYLLGMVLPSSVVNALLVVSLVVLSGGLHLDGLADTCDGLAKQGTPDEKRRVMHDSRVGGLGVIGIVLILLVKYISLNSLPSSLMTFSLIIAPLISRWAMVYAIFAYPYGRASGLGRAFKQATGWRELVIATVIALVLAAGLLKLAGLAVLFIVWLLTMAIATYLKRRFAGLTGDTYGAINEVAESTVFILLSLLAYNHWLV
jgi:adenosylcobinamide-GDP ribazoletransferase